MPAQPIIRGITVCLRYRLGGLALRLLNTADLVLRKPRSALRPFLLTWSVALTPWLLAWAFYGAALWTAVQPTVAPIVVTLAIVCLLSPLFLMLLGDRRPAREWRIGREWIERAQRDYVNWIRTCFHRHPPWPTLYVRPDQPVRCRCEGEPADHRSRWCPKCGGDLLQPPAPKPPLSPRARRIRTIGSAILFLSWIPALIMLHSGLNMLHALFGRLPSAMQSAPIFIILFLVVALVICCIIMAIMFGGLSLLSQFTGEDYFNRRRRKGECIQCGYPLKGNTSGTCPECGTPISEQRKDDAGTA